MALSDLAKRNIARIEHFGEKPCCGNCDFWGFVSYDMQSRKAHGECRIHEFLTTRPMVCDEWELD